MQSLDAPRVMLFLAAVLCCSIGVGGLLLLALWRSRLAAKASSDDATKPHHAQAPPDAQPPD